MDSMISCLDLLKIRLPKAQRALDVKTQKGCWPYKFVGEDNQDYIGPRPDEKYDGDSGEIPEGRRPLGFEI